jgi:RNA polymerase sigma-70 factor (ECF subfamily)
MDSNRSGCNELSAWYVQFYQHLVQIGVRFGCPKEDVKDLISQFFLSLVEKKINPDQIENVKAYLSVAFYRVLIENNRGVNKKRSACVGLGKAYEPSIQEIHEHEQTNIELILRLRQAYQKLPGRCQKVIFLKYYEGLTTDQIAKRTGLTTRSIYNNLFEGVRLLRSAFKQEPSTVASSSSSSSSSSSFSELLVVAIMFYASKIFF